MRGYPLKERSFITINLSLPLTSMNGKRFNDTARYPYLDLADQILVATARIWQIPLVTQDARILEYPHINLFRLS